MNFDRKRFFDGYRSQFSKLTQGQVAGLETLLGFIEADQFLTDIRRVSYMLATIKHEADDKYEPIEEYGKGKGKKYGRADPVTGLVYYGRGYTQTTWKENYLKLSVAWNKLHPHEEVDFVAHPELLLVPRYSYFGTSYAMRVGLYTGRKLSDYINENFCNYFQARRIINILDEAELIAGHAVKFERVLGASSV